MGFRGSGVPAFRLACTQKPFTNLSAVSTSLTRPAFDTSLTRRSAQWGGTRDEYFTGHMTNGKRVMSDAREVTRQVVAGLAQALSGDWAGRLVMIACMYDRVEKPGGCRSS